MINQAQLVDNCDISQFELSKAITFSRFFNKIKLTPSARLVLRCLVDHWNTEKQCCYPKQATIADMTGYTRKAVNAAIDELRKSGLILTASVVGERAKYYLTKKFFEIITTQGCEVITPEEREVITHHKQINNKQKNNIHTQKNDDDQKNLQEANLEEHSDGSKNIQGNENKNIENISASPEYKNILESLLKIGFKGAKNFIKQQGLKKAQLLIQYVDKKGDIKNKGAYIRQIQHLAESELIELINKIGSNKVESVNYPSVQDTKAYIESVKQDNTRSSSPLDLPREDAINWYSNAPDFVKNGVFGKKIKDKYNL